MCGVLVMGSVPIIAKVGKQAIDVVYNNIKLEVNGIKTKMPSGVEPFIYNGTTYLPVRAVAEALGEEVSFDKKNYTVYVGSRAEKLAAGKVKMSEYVKKVKPIIKGSAKGAVFGDSLKIGGAEESTYIVNRSEKYPLDSAFYHYYYVDVYLKDNFKTLSGVFIPNEKSQTCGYGIFDADSVYDDGYVVENEKFMDNFVLLRSTDHDKVITGNAYDGIDTGFYAGYNARFVVEPFKTDNKPVPFEIDVTGVDKLRLVVDGGVFNNLVLTPLK